MSNPLAGRSIKLRFTQAWRRFASRVGLPRRVADARLRHDHPHHAGGVSTTRRDPEPPPFCQQRGRVWEVLPPSGCGRQPARAAIGSIALAILPLLANPAAAADRALIIGIARYPNLPALKQLTGPVNDARLMERLAREVWGFVPDQIKLLIDEAATSTAIRAEIERWLIAGSKPGDRILFYYAGHGYYAKTGNPNEPDGVDETLAPADVVQRGASYDNMILDDEIDTYLRRLEGRDVVLIVDACHSGTITRSLAPSARDGPSIVRSLDHGRVTRGADGNAEARFVTEEVFGRLRHRKVLVSPHPHVLAFSAVASTELAHEDMGMPEPERLGVFTRRFADGLMEGRAASREAGAVTVAGLLSHLRHGAFAYCETFPCRTGMTPSLEAPAAMLARDLRSWRPGAASGAAGPGPKPATTPVHPADLFPSPHASGVRVEILARAAVQRGETTQVPLREIIKLRVTSDKPGWLVVLDVREDGRVVQLFPSKCARKERQVRAGAPLTLPDDGYGCEFTATEIGVGRILAIATEDNVPLDALLARHRDLEIVPAGRDPLAEIAQALLKVWTGDARNRPARWGLATARYEVVR